MNVIVSNQKKDVLDALNIDVIKSINGQYDADELIEMFKNFYYQRMILDITAIKNYRDIKVLQKLSISLDMEKVILLLDDSEESSSPDYLSKLISMGIYNFTKNAEGVMYLYNNPNSYRDVAQYHQIDNTPTEQVVYQTVESNFSRVIGVSNLTEHAGATTFIYMMVKQLQRNYNVVGVEIDKRDFGYFRSEKLQSISSSELSKFIEDNKDKDAIIVDVGNSKPAMAFVHEMIYLMSPSTLKLNKLLNYDRNIFKELSDRKIVLNQSFLSPKDVLELQYEVKTNFFFNMPPLNERDNDIAIMDTFLARLGFSKQQNSEAEKKKRKLGLF